MRKTFLPMALACGATALAPMQAKIGHGEGDPFSR